MEGMGGGGMEGRKMEIQGHGLFTPSKRLCSVFLCGYVLWAIISNKNGNSNSCIQYMVFFFLLFDWKSFSIEKKDRINAF